MMDELDTKTEVIRQTTGFPTEERQVVPLRLTKTEPWPHQVQAARLLESQTATMLAHDMGTGKTKVVIDAIVNFGWHQTLIVCPKSVIPVWPEEFAKHAARPVKVIALGEGPVSQRTERAKQALDLAHVRDEQIALIVNYEAVWRALFGLFVLDQRWDLIVCDEIHRIKSARGRASRFMKRTASLASRRVGLTGTPMPHSPLDIFGQYRFLNCHIFGRYVTNFRNRYAVMGGYRPPGATRGVEVLGYQNLDELQEKFRSIAHQVRKADVLDLPPTTHERRHVELAPPTLSAYRQMERDFVVQVEAGTVTAGNALTKLLRMQQLTSGFLRVDPEETRGEIVEPEIGTEKRDALIELLEDIRSDEPVVVFCRFRHDLDAVGKATFQVGRQVYELSGRRNQLAQWKGSEAGAVLAAQIQAGSVGVDFSRAAYAVYFSLGFSLGDYQQSLARLDRPGQTRPVTYIHLVATGTIDERVYQALQRREQVVNHVLGIIQKGEQLCLAQQK